MGAGVWMRCWSSLWPASWPGEHTLLTSVSLVWASNTADHQHAGVGTAVPLSHP